MPRRTFLKSATATGLGIALSQRSALAAGAPSDKVRVGVMGLNGRGVVLARTFARSPNVEVAYLCDVDALVLDKSALELGKVQQQSAKAVRDFRRILDDKSVDGIVIATPDHWQTPAAILAMKAGKHVYVEKPSGHNAREAELIVQCQEKHQRVVQIGTQQRSHDRSREIIAAIHGGAIGSPYQARAWYANTRTSIGRGQEAPVPAHLDYEMWQGPAPRTAYRDNVIHYNWHWFWRWGTSEVCNNGTHEIDIARWALGVERPLAVSSVGGRFHFQDDWEMPDTQEVCYEFAGGKSIIWQGASCNGAQTHGRSRGTVILGTNGSVVMDRDGYTIYDLKNKFVKENIGPKGDALNVTADDNSTLVHATNFADAVRGSTALHAPIAQGATSVMLCHLGNIAQRVGRKLRIDPATGHIQDDAEASRLWQREYAPEWAPSL
ncbi:MAG: Gfo/Idh/MocA family oxidoreductase [Gemmatimonadaceae bacterium]